MSIFEIQENDKQSKIDSAIDNIKEKYGFNKISRGNEMNNHIERKCDYK